mmetsp:Transcript_146950/g.259710  ORF Transcript_146950/g.259710 Transcript_146950/m.259710 type:complete len:1281 (+) Transcript_146950:92-3934(+)
MCKGSTAGNIWEVVGGASNGGIVVRTGKEVTSKEESERLVTGSLVEELEGDDGRICYMLLSGTGPSCGWVSTTFRGKDLLVKTTKLPEDAPLLTEIQEIDQEAEEEEDDEGEEFEVDPLVFYSLRMAALQEEDLQEDDTTGDLAEVAKEVKPQIKKEKKNTLSSSSPMESAIAEPVPFKDGKFNKESLEKICPKEAKAAPAPRVSRAPTLGRQFKQAGKPITGARPKLVSASEEAKLAAVPPAPKADTSKQTAQKEESCKQIAQSNADAKAAPTAPRGTEPIFFSGPAKSAAIQKALQREHDLDTGKLCRFCRLPVGDSSYFHESARAWVHGECYAQLMVQDFMEDDEKRLQEEASLKRARRNEYDIGWKVESIPRNMEPAVQMGCTLVPQGLCCVIMQDDFKSVRVVPTIEPAAAMNLEYLSTALKVRRKEGREPVFSLDPVDLFDHDASDKNAMQMKRFEPEWLATTRAGEVLFQSDYHLKELSMGEYNQPVVGMKSAFEYSSSRRDMEDEWSAREWFLVRDAKIQMSDDNVVVPYVRMGVEAREQVLNGNVMIDAPITRKDHPMVKYAEAFTRNFDLIAERKSVVYSLRELAKASVLAKFLIDSQIKLEDTWYNLADESQDCCSLEIPQLWNERMLAQVQMKDGEINFEDVCPTMKGVYGGVEFGLERFTLTTEDKPRVAAKLGGTMRAATGLPSVGMGRIVQQEGAPPPKISLRGPAVAGAPAAASVAASQIPASVMQMLSAAALSAPRRVAPTRVRAAGPTQLRKMAPLDKAVPPARMALPLGLSTTSTVSTVSTTSTVPPISQRGVTPLIATGTVSTVSTAPSFSLSGAPLIARTAGGSLSALGAPRPGAYSTVLPSQRAQNIELAGAAPGTALSAATPMAGLGAFSSALPAATVGTLTSPVAARNFVPARFRTMTAGMTPQASLSAGPQGVDLNLDQFNLTTPVATEGDAWVADQGVKSAAMGNAFWASLDQDGAEFCAEDRKLLRAIYDPELSDRREEGDRFVPPDTSYNYVQRLRKLVQEEETCRDQRLEHFLSPAFSAAVPGDLFPGSWKSSVEIANKEASRDLHACYFEDQELELHRMLKSASPSFENSTEEGIRFRVYDFGSLEVRTTQQPSLDSKEIIGAVFSTSEPVAVSGECMDTTGEHEDSKVAKVTEYIERADGTRHSYIVIESDSGATFVTEKLSNGQATWEQNPAGLEARNSLAKVVRLSEELQDGTNVRSMKNMQAMNDWQAGFPASASQRKRYAQAAYSHALGATQGQIYTGFVKKDQL